MKVCIASYEPSRLGGGWSFSRNLAKGLGDDFTTDYEQADIYLIPSASMISRDDAIKAKDDGKKIVLRVDNILRNSRNRNSGMTRMFDMAQLADQVVYQSGWAKVFLAPFLKKSGVIIHNGIDLDIFKPSSVFKWDYSSRYLYSRFNRDEGKNWQSAWYYFYFKNLEDKSAKLFITGQYTPELIEFNFDFFNGEYVKYLGILTEAEMADAYRMCKYFIYTYSFDACSNSLIEALASNCKIVGDNYYKTSGGAKEITTLFRQEGRSYFGLERMANQYLQEFDKL